MKKILVTLLVLLTLAGCSQTASTVGFDSLERLSFDDYQSFLDDGKSGVIYFGWIDRCPDSALVQKNYIYKLVEDNEDLQSNMYVVDLDQELPDGLTDKDARIPMTEKFGVKYGPTLILVENGEVVDLIEWTPLTSDDKTAIPKEILDDFFSLSGYVR